MRRIALIIAGLLALAALAATSATGQGEDDGGSYLVRAYFDNAGFLVQGEDVRIAGASVGSVQEVDVAREGEVVGIDGEVDPGKAVVTMNISDPGFQDFRSDASCLIRPQSLLGEKFVECDPTQPRAPGSTPPPPLEQIPDGEIGEGEYFLPIENNGKAIDLDLVNNITRESEIERFRLILNNLGAGLAARGDDLAVVLERANPALKQTDRVLSVLAAQNRGLAQLAEDSDTILTPLARERESLGGFIRNASIAGAAAAERRDDIVLGFERFPPALAELESTMIELQKFAAQGEPLATNLQKAAPALTGATEALGPFSRSANVALTSLGQAAEDSGANLAASAPVIRQLRTLGLSGIAPAKSLTALLKTFRKTKGIDYLMRFVLNTSNIFNGFDQYGHYLRTQLQITNCVDFVITPTIGCDANWQAPLEPASASRFQPPITQEMIDTLRAPIAGVETDEATFGARPSDGSGAEISEPSAAGSGELGPERDAAAAEADAAAAQGTQDLLEFLTGDGR